MSVRSPGRLPREALSDRSIRALKRVGRHADGRGLYIAVSLSGSKQWRFVWRTQRADAPGKWKMNELSLGPYPAVGLADARTVAAACRALLAAGDDPRKARVNKAAPASIPTFAEVMEEYLATKVAALRNDKHRAQWRFTLERYASGLLPMPVAEIGAQHVLDVLKPIWSHKPETASRLRGRIESVLNAAKARGLRQGENPAAWRGHLANLLPARNKRLSVRHFAARPWQDMPALMAELPRARSISSLCLQFIIFTACRSGEARGARWDEVDVVNRVWTLPAVRTKTARGHRVPLSQQAVDVLETVRPLVRETGDLVFPGGRPGRPLSDVAVTNALRAFDPVATVHGMRSSFRDWAGESTAHPREIAEQALGHVIGNAAEQAYRRGDALEKRRSMMEEWAKFLLPK